MVTFSCEAIRPVQVMLDETPASVTGGYGGWTVVPRQRRVGITQWIGKDPFRMAIPILFDGFKSATGCELDISRLSRMALPPAGGGEPPVIQVRGAAIPRPGPTKWVIESITWGTNKVVWDSVGGGVRARTRQDAVVNLLQYASEDRVAFAAMPAIVKNGPSKVGWPKSHFLRQGETLQSVAVLYYGDSSSWTKIAAANGLRDPKAAKVGTNLKIPAP